MAHLIGNKVLVKVNNPGTGAFVLPSQAEDGRVHLSFLLANGDTTYYSAEATDGTLWEDGLGTYSTTANGQLSRDTVYSTQAGVSESTMVNFTGEVFLFITIPRAKLIQLDPDGYLIDGAGEYHAREKVLTDTGAADAYVVAPGLTTYKAGQILRVLIANANTGAATLDAGQGAKPIKTADGSDPGAGAIPAALVSFIDDGTNYRILGSGGSGGLVQRVTGTYATYTSTATRFPVDDTVPQNTEGAEAATVAITPKSATNTLRITLTAVLAGSAAASLGMGLFQDSTANALAAVGDDSRTTGALVTVTLVHEMAAGTTSATTFKMRYGADSGTGYINGSSSGRKFGGVMKATITVEEFSS